MSHAHSHRVTPGMHYATMAALIISNITVLALAILFSNSLLGSPLGYFARLKEFANIPDADAAISIAQHDNRASRDEERITILRKLKSAFNLYADSHPNEGWPDHIYSYSDDTDGWPWASGCMTCQLLPDLMLPYVSPFPLDPVNSTGIYRYWYRKDIEADTPTLHLGKGVMGAGLETLNPSAPTCQQYSGSNAGSAFAIWNCDDLETGCNRTWGGQPHTYVCIREE